jgi:cytochrome P450
MSAKRPARTEAIRGGDKTAGLAIGGINPARLAGAIKTHAAARDLLRCPQIVQAGGGTSVIDRDNPEEVTLFYIDGEEHRRRRAAIAPYFALKTVESRYEPIMVDLAGQLVSELAEAGEARLDKLAFRFAVAVAAEVLGLDWSDLPGLTARIEATVNTDTSSHRPMKELTDEAVRSYYETDILPAIEARQRAPGEDVISRMLADGFSPLGVATEVRGYSFAGMVTTRELIVMCAWYLLENPNLMERFRTGGKREQLGIIEEILRLEPIVGYIRRTAASDVDIPSSGSIAGGSTLIIDVRAANTDAAETGPCPHLIDPERGGAHPPGSSYMSFGDGPHRCPGAQLALAESRAFLDALVRLPGLRLVGQPEVAWFRPIASYVFNKAVVACD